MGCPGTGIGAKGILAGIASWLASRRSAREDMDKSAAAADLPMPPLLLPVPVTTVTLMTGVGMPEVWTSPL